MTRGGRSAPAPVITATAVQLLYQPKMEQKKTMKKLSIFRGICYVLAVFILAVMFTPVPAAAATNDITKGNAGNGYSFRDSGYFYVVDNVLDLSETATVSNDVVNLLHITGGSLLQSIVYYVDTPTTNASITFDIGDSDGATTWISAASATNTHWGGSSLAASSSSTSFPVSVSLSGGGKFYADDDIIDLDFNLDPGNTGKIRVKAALIYQPDLD